MKNVIDAFRDYEDASNKGVTVAEWYIQLLVCFKWLIILPKMGCKTILEIWIVKI
jgi:hypothetical protein